MKETAGLPQDLADAYRDCERGSRWTNASDGLFCAGDCVKLTREAALACSPTDAARDARNQACGKAVEGTKAPGQACGAPIECAPSSNGSPYCTCIANMGCVMVPGYTGDKARCYDSDGLFLIASKSVCSGTP